MSKPGSSVLKGLFLAQQEAMRSALEAEREVIDHAGLKGTASEERWRELLVTHLPQRYRVATGIVVDHKGRKSRQTDVIIHDAHYCPLFRKHGNVSFVPAESVYAVLDVKQVIEAETLRDAAKKARSVRQLSRTSGKIIDRGREMPPREPPPIIAGIVGLTTGWSGGLGAKFRAQLAEHVGDHRLDLGCALDAGAFEVPDGKGPRSVVMSTREVSLVSFLLGLLRRLQGLGTVPAIDWSSYETALYGRLGR